ncbi:hypothetical protein, partial [Staphylococcus simiae]|uniref:hypothetical protein n=1 Tax=Staphylococcus simiae TaxID=308354 RepID=UPI00198214F4
HVRVSAILIARKSYAVYYEVINCKPISDNQFLYVGSLPQESWLQINFRFKIIRFLFISPKK